MNPEVCMELEDTKDIKTSICGGCLSSNRKLKPLGAKVDIFCKLFDDLTLMPQSDILLCWECTALLRKLELFKEKVDHAQTVLSFYHLNPTTLPEPLTTLTVTSMPPVDNCFMLKQPVEDCDHSEVEFKQELPDKSELFDVKDFERNDDVIQNDSEPDDNICNNDTTEIITKTREQKRKLEAANINNNKIRKTKDKPEIKTILKNSNDNDTDYKTQVNDTKNVIKTKSGDEGDRGPKRKYKKRHKFKLINRCYKDSKHLLKKVPINPVDSTHWMKIDRNSELFRNMIYKCDKCVEPLIKSRLAEHTKLHTKSVRRKYFCNVCKVWSESKSAKSRHLARHSNIYQCTLCRIKICNRILMHHHLKSCSRLVQCSECKANLPTKSDFRQHVKKFHSIYICDHCGEIGKTKTQMKRHMMKRHSEYRHCKLCDRSFKYFDKHIKLHHTKEMSDQAFCVECDIRFPNIYAYKEHISKSRAHNRERYEKSSTFSSVNQARKHLFTKKTANWNIYRQRKLFCISISCEQCSELSILNQRRFSCPEVDCSKVYKTAIALKDHHDFVHKKDSRHKCSHCDKQFSSGCRLGEHTRSVHLGIKPEKNKICNYCGRGFSNNRILTHHMRTHTGERPYQCEDCDANFAQKVAMKMHMKNVHNKLGRGYAEL